MAGSSINITDGIFVRAAAVMVVTTGGTLKRAASPFKAETNVLIDTTACAFLRACVVFIADYTRLGRRRRGWTGVRRVLPILDWVRGFYCNPALASFSAGQITLQLDISTLPPVRAP